MNANGIPRSLAACLWVFLLGAAPPVSAENSRGVQLLRLGKIVEVTLATEERSRFAVIARRGQFVAISIQSDSVELSSALFAPNGAMLLESGGAVGRFGLTPICFIANSGGKYILEARPYKGSAGGRFTVRLDEKRAAVPQDRRRVSGDALLLEAERLRRKGTAQSQRSAISKYEEAASVLGEGGARAHEAIALQDMGAVLNMLGEKPIAMERLNQALKVWDSVGDPQGKAQTLTYLGELHHSLSQNERALALYREALALRRVAKDIRGEGETLNNMGGVYETLGDRQAALQYFTQALPLRRQAGDSFGEGYTLNNIGSVLSAMGERQRALEHYAQAMEVRRKYGDRRGEAYTLNNIAAVYLALGEPETALNFLTRALDLLRTLGDRRREGTALQNLGSIRHEMGDHEEARRLFTEALEIRREVSDRRGEAQTLSNLASDSFETGDKEKALQLHNQALTLWREVSDRQGEGQSLGNLGWVYQDLGDREKALAHYRQALELLQSVRDRRWEATTRYRMSLLEMERRNWGEAQLQVEKAIELVENLRADVGSPGLRSSYFASVRNYYDLYMELLMQLHREKPGRGFDAKALEASERARARSLLELLSEARANLRKRINPELDKREQSLRHLLNAKSERQLRLLSGKSQPGEVTALEKEIEELAREHEQVEATIRTASPRYAALTKPQALGLREIQQLLDEDTLLLEYALGKRQSFLWVVTSRSLASFSLAPRSELETTARRCYELLTERNRRPPFETAEERRARIAAADEQYLASATKLSQGLLAPAAPLLAKKRLLIVADEALQYLPFAALPAPAASPSPGELSSVGFVPLASAHEIVHLPSAAALAIQRRELSSRAKAPKLLAVFADPVFSLEDERVSARERPRTPQRVAISSDLQRALWQGSPEQPGPIRRLPHTRGEAQAILEAVPPSSRIVAFDFRASRALATDASLSEFRFLHFATHGFLNNVHPELSGILLSLVNEKGAEQPGFLQALDIFNLKLPAELVVLSGCRTGLGKEMRGEGLLGLTRAFLYAGAARTMVSLWDVQDESTAELMALFYRALFGKDRPSPAAALRDAQRALWNNRSRRAPYYWAGFAVQGEPQWDPTATFP